MDNKKHFVNSLWVGVPASLYNGYPFDGRLATQTAYFRKEFDLGEQATLTMHVSASTRYRLYVNGKAILSGPCKSDRYRHFYETIDVSQYLVLGKNIIALKVVAYPPYEAQHRSGEGQGPHFAINYAAGPCLAVSGEVLDKQGQVLSKLHTGTTQWKVCLDRAIEWDTPKLTFWMGGMEVVHGSKLPMGWECSPTPQGIWDVAETRLATQPGDHGQIIHFPLMERPIPLLYEKEIDFTREMPQPPSDFAPFSFGEEIPPNTKASIELDAGTQTSAFVAIKMKGGRGAKLVLKYAESYSKEIDLGYGDQEDHDSPANTVLYMAKGQRDDSLNYELIGHHDVYYPSGGQDEYVPFWFRVFRFMRLEVCTGDEAITIEKPTMVETAYPLETVTTFHSSDKELDQVWKISQRTLQMCMHETYEDCPYYEQMQYTADTRLQMLFTYALGGDTRLGKRAIDDYHASLMPDGMIQSRYPVQVPQAIPMFAFHWIFMLEDIYWESGDTAVPRRYRPTVDAILDWHERYLNEDGLLENMPYWQFLDWVPEWMAKHGKPNAAFVGPSTAHNMVYVYGLQAAARLNRRTGRPDAAREYEIQAEKLKSVIEAKCWNAEAGLYMEGPGFAEYSQHSQVFAVLTGMATGERATSIMTKALEQEGLSKCSFPWMFYFIRALEMVGMYDRATVFFDVLKEFARLNVSTVPEDPFMPRSECHAWGAFPLYEFPRMLLGVKQGAAGWGEIVIQPHFMAADSCGGTVYTPKGNVDIAWEKGEKGICVRGTVPTDATFVYPCGKQEKLAAGAFEIWLS